MKRIFSLTMALLLISAMVISADDMAATEVLSSREYIMSQGVITDVGEGYILLEKDDKTEHMFVLDSETYVLDALSSNPINIDSLNDSKAAVYHSMATTMSIPPQSYAYAIIINPSSDNGTAVYSVVEAVDKDNDTYILTTDGGSLKIIINSDTEVLPHLVKRFVTAEDITVNSKLLVWHDLVTTSIPAITDAKKIVILEQGEANLHPFIVVSGKKIALNDDEEAYYDGDKLMIPIRTVAENLGYEVIWNENPMTVTLNKEDFSTSVFVYKANSFIELAPSAKKAVLNVNKTYVEISFFDEL